MPTSEITLSDDDLIEFLNEELNIGLVPSILQNKDEYLVYKDSIPVVPGNSIYPIPPRAIGNKLREVNYSDDGRNEYNMTQVAVDDKMNNAYIQQSGFFANQFYVEGSDIVLHPNSFSFSGYLIMYYYLRPNYLVKDEKVAYIKSIDRTAGTITLNTVPSTYNTGLLFDFINCDSPNDILKIDVPVISINTVTKTITLDPSNIPSDLGIEDYVAIAGESCVPNVPTELHPMLAQRVAMRALEALGDTQGLQNAKMKLDEMEAKSNILLNSRIEGSPRKIKSRTMQYTLRGRFIRGVF
jgi:hypothetical protein